MPYEPEKMIASLHGKCGKLHHTQEIPDSETLCDPPPVLEHNGKLYLYEDGIERLKSLGLDWEDIDTWYFIEFEPVKL